MTISELIEDLEAIEDDYGDMDVVYESDRHQADIEAVEVKVRRGMGMEMRIVAVLS